MDTINRWLDADEVRHLAEQLMGPPPGTAASMPDAGFDTAFVGFTETTASALSAVPVMNAAPVASQKSVVNFPATPAPPPVRVAFAQRISAFCDGLRQKYCAEAVFLLDQEGQVIFGKTEHPRFHFLAQNLARESRRTHATVRNVRLKISATTSLELIPTATERGLLVLGAVFSQSLPPRAVAELKETLTQTAIPSDF